MSWPIKKLLLSSLFLLSGCGSLVTHEVQPGETLYSIGWQYGQDYRRIAAWNNIPPPYLIHKGQVLRVVPPETPWWEEEKLGNQGRSPVQSKVVSAGASQRKNRIPLPPADAPDTGPVPEFRWPAQGQVAHDRTHGAAQQKGIDILGRRGQPILAAAAGRVVYSGSGLRGYGKLIIIKHNNTYLSAYAHNEQILVREGDSVQGGQKIAEMGVTGEGDALLYFEIRRHGKPVDVMQFLVEDSK